MDSAPTGFDPMVGVAPLVEVGLNSSFDHNLSSDLRWKGCSSCPLLCSDYQIQPTFQAEGRFVYVQTS